MMTNKPTRFLAHPATRLHDELHRGADVWTIFNPAQFPGAVNLGQGFMNWKPPMYVLEQMQQALIERTDLHHYSPARGRPRLLEQLRDTYSSSFRKPMPDSTAVSQGVVEYGDNGLPIQRPDHGVPLDTSSEMVVTAGANEAMYSVTTAFLNEGDEVVLFEPFFDQYVCETTFNGGTPVYIPMVPPPPGQRVVSGNDWTFDWAKLEEKLASPKAKALFLNTPHNPIGKVCTFDELQRIAQLCIKHDILVISDEVYDCLTYDGHEHIRIASFSGMWERTITIGSAGKSFSCTGWRIGWAIGAPHLITPTLAAHVRITFCVNSLAAEGAAMAFEGAQTNDFFNKQRAEYSVRRKELTDVLDELGMSYTMPYGSYFVLVDVSNLKIPTDFDLPEQVARKPRDYHVCWFIAKTCNVVTIPLTAFCSPEGIEMGQRFIRFAFCKDGQMGEAALRLRKVCHYLHKRMDPKE